MIVFQLTPSTDRQSFTMRVQEKIVTEPDKKLEHFDTVFEGIERHEIEQLVRECLSSNGLGYPVDKGVSRPL